MKSRTLHHLHQAIQHLTEAQHVSNNGPKQSDDEVVNWLEHRAELLEEADWSDMEMEAVICEHLAQWFETPTESGRLWQRRFRLLVAELTPIDVKSVCDNIKDREEEEMNDLHSALASLHLQFTGIQMAK